MFVSRAFQKDGSRSRSRSKSRKKSRSKSRLVKVKFKVKVKSMSRSTAIIICKVSEMFALRTPQLPVLRTNSVIISLTVWYNYKNRKKRVLCDVYVIKQEWLRMEKKNWSIIILKGIQHKNKKNCCKFIRHKKKKLHILKYKTEMMGFQFDRQI